MFYSATTMRLAANRFEENARKCQQRADAVPNLALRSFYVDMAYQWRTLSAMMLNLSIDAKQWQDFHKGGIQSPPAEDPIAREEQPKPLSH